MGWYQNFIILILLQYFKTLFPFYLVLNGYKFIIKDKCCSFIIMMFYRFSNYTNGLYMPDFKMPKFNINCNKIEISIKKFQLDRGD
jgi:hypothetical protein